MKIVKISSAYDKLSNITFAKCWAHVRRYWLKVDSKNGRVGLPAENAIRVTVIGRKNWLFSVSEAGAKANAICLSLAETAKASGFDFYKYLVKLLTY